MDAEPEPTPVTRPVAETVATAASLVCQEMWRSLSVSRDASMAVATRRRVSLGKSVAAAGSTDTDATGDGGVVVELQATNAARTMVPRSCFMVSSLLSNAAPRQRDQVGCPSTALIPVVSSTSPVPSALIRAILGPPG